MKKCNECLKLKDESKYLKVLDNNDTLDVLCKMCRAISINKDIQDGLFTDIDQLYKISRLLNHHVDHIIPKKHKDACGLHVILNMQLLPPDVNISKNNRYDLSKMTK